MWLALPTPQAGYRIRDAKAECRKLSKYKILELFRALGTRSVKAPTYEALLFE